MATDALVAACNGGVFALIFTLNKQALSKVTGQSLPPYHLLKNVGIYGSAFIGVRLGM